MRNNTFGRFKPPKDTLWLTPDENGIQFALTPADLDGNELVAVMFNDTTAGPIAFAIHPAAAQIISEGVQSVIANAAYLRVENNKIRNEKEGTTND